jgi:glyoxylase-like metal-dependent hydrolase (beta-lactamase superfamily II)
MNEIEFAPTITALDCGRLRQQERTLLQGGSKDVIEIPVAAWLVRHPAGDVVFDAGLHPSLAHSPESLGPMAKLFEAVLEPDGGVRHRLEQHAVDPDGRFTVVLSHCHFDHCGGLVDLPNAHVVVQADEWQAVLGGGQAGGYDPALIDLGHDVLQVAGEHDVFGDGSVVCVPTPGHTCGHQSLLVLTEGHPTLLTGDACYFMHTLDDAILPPFGFDHDQQRASLEWIRQQRLSGTTIIPGHDADVLRAWLDRQAGST